MDINKFTEKAREAVSEAQSLAAGMGHQETDVEHLALALTQQENGIVPRILDQMGVQPRAFAVAVEGALRKRPSVSGGGMDPTKIMITQRLAKILGDAQNEANRMKDEYVSVDHLFAALTDVAPSSPLGEVFKEYKIARARFVAAMEELRGGARVTSATPEDTFEALTKYARDLVEAARQGKMDPVIGRDAEIRRVIRILSRRSVVSATDEGLALAAALRADIEAQYQDLETHMSQPKLAQLYALLDELIALHPTEEEETEAMQDHAGMRLTETAA